jgi:hypothetical protein
MSSTILFVLNITDKRSYHAWCLENHPDKRPNDPHATRRFQEVGAEWRRVNEQHGGPTGAPPPQPKPKPKPPPAPPKPKPTPLAHPRDRCSQTGVNTHSGRCSRKKYKNAQHCFYHMPGTDHMRFVDNGVLHQDFFGPFYMFENIFKAERTEKTCESKCVDQKWCTKLKTTGSKFCTTHDPNRVLCGHPTKSGSSCIRTKTKHGHWCSQHTNVILKTNMHM